MRRLVLLSIAGALALAAAIVLFTYLYERPTILRVAVVRGSEDQEIMTAAAQDFVHERETIHLSLVPVDSLAATATALEHGRADLAIVRSDVEMPTNGQTVLIMRKSAGLFLTSSGSGIGSVADLRGKKIGIVHDPMLSHAANLNLLNTTLAQYDIPESAVGTVALSIEQIEKALTNKEVDAVLAFGMPGSDKLSEAVAAVTRASGGKIIFISVPEAEGIAQRSPNYESVEIVRGLFPGIAPQPTKSFHTLGVSTRLVARSTLSDTVVGDLTRILLAARPRIALRVPVAARIVAPETDKGAVLPVHPGAAAYLDDEAESFFDKYSDAFYIGAMILSVFGSAIAALASRVSQMQREGTGEAIRRLLDILREAREADHTSELDLLEREADVILAQSLSAKGSSGPDLGALSLAVDQVRHAIEERRKVLLASPKAVFEPRLIPKI
ncbi:TAXI family TRAP transporter solute-binding subunit [Methyloferula stellata]|uniref:TAXI family TRAP transporter solute-binding subunit n=1 Tax=Methyloferula stellata TaxID=876270 RepID=UPI00035FA50B|nr:TAXI family TRAP transporter solute-binding subunit [Methyloferula stellata]